MNFPYHIKQKKKLEKKNREKGLNKSLEDAGIDPATSRMLSARSTI